MTHFYKSIWSSQRSSTHQSFGNICCFLTTIPKWIIPILVSEWPVHLSVKEALEAMESRQWLTTLKFLGPRKNGLLFENNKWIFRKQLHQECPWCKFHCCFPHLRLQPISVSMHSWTESFRDFLQILESFRKIFFFFFNNLMWHEKSFFYYLLSN